MAHLQALPCLEWVVKEAFRLSMAISCRLPRVIPKDGWTLDGCHSPSGTNVGISAFELHLNPKTFPQPHKFLPDRWLEASAEMHRDWLPFGKGARGCIARNLALTELSIATENLELRMCSRVQELLQNGSSYMNGSILGPGVTGLSRSEQIIINIIV